MRKAKEDSKTFKELYLEARHSPTPAQRFIREIMDCTYFAENTIKAWILGTQIPPRLAQEAIARHFKTTPEALFPEPRKSKEEQGNG